MYNHINATFTGCFLSLSVTDAVLLKQDVRYGHNKSGRLS